MKTMKLFDCVLGVCEVILSNQQLTYVSFLIMFE